MTDIWPKKKEGVFRWTKRIWLSWSRKLDIFEIITDLSTVTYRKILLEYWIGLQVLIHIFLFQTNQKFWLTATQIVFSIYSSGLKIFVETGYKHVRNEAHLNKIRADQWMLEKPKFAFKTWIWCMIIQNGCVQWLLILFFCKPWSWAEKLRIPVPGTPFPNFCIAFSSCGSKSTYCASTLFLTVFAQAFTMCHYTFPPQCSLRISLGRHPPIPPFLRISIFFSNFLLSFVSYAI